MFPSTRILSDVAPLLQYKWGADCEAYTLVDNDDLSVKLEQMPPGSEEEWHLHQKAQQFFYVLQGTARIDMGNESVVLHRSQGLLVAPGVPHRIANTDSVTLKFLLCSQPNPQKDRQSWPAPASLI